MATLHTYKCRIQRIIDGDTVVCEWIDLGMDVRLYNQTIRLYGIDTPESRTKDLREKKFGLLAKQFLKDNLNKECYVTTVKDTKGKFGRLLGIFRNDLTDKPINTLLVENHLAVEYHGQSKNDIMEQHLQNWEILEEQSR